MIEPNAFCFFENIWSNPVNSQQSTEQLIMQGDIVQGFRSVFTL